MMKGVDVSKYQVGLTMAMVKKAGYDFAILRGGYTGYGSERTKHTDNCFERFYNQAKSIGLPVGVYYYSCATNKQEGIDEANFLYQTCLKDKKFEMPIYIDVEDTHWQTNKRKGVTEAIIGFCSYLESLGFYTGVYASHYWFINRIDTGKLKAYSKWVASWSERKPEVKFSGFQMWQNSNEGLIGSVRVDTNEAYINFPKIIKDKGLNGYGVKENKLHVVKAGETLTSIASKYGTTVDILAKTNSIKNINKIVVGQVLKVN